MTKLFFDIETNGQDVLHGGVLLLNGWAVDDGEVCVETNPLLAEATDPVSSVFVDLWFDPDVTKVSHSSYDIRWFLLSQMSEVKGPIHDTKVMAWVLNENTPLDIDWLTHRYCGLDMDKRLKRADKRVWFTDDEGTLHALDETPKWNGFVWNQFKDYNRRDVEALRELYYALEDRLVESDWWKHYEEEQVPYTGVLRRMETLGLPIDLEETAELEQEVVATMAEAHARLLEEASLPSSFNLNSQQQLNGYLFSRAFVFNESLDWGSDAVACLKSCLDGEHDDCEVAEFRDEAKELPDEHISDLLPPGFIIDKVGRTRVEGHYELKGRGLAPTKPTRNKQTGELGKLPSTSSPDLLYMHASDDWVRSLCTGYRKLYKLETTYLSVFPKIAVRDTESTSTRLFGQFNQTGTVTGRLSSSNPNLQNQPSRGKLGKRVRHLFKGNFVIGDYDQIEMRLMAHLSGDRQMLKVFNDGLDPHIVTVQAIFGDVDPLVTPSGAAVTYRDAGKNLNYAMGYGAYPKRIAQTMSLLGWPTGLDEAASYLMEMERFYQGYFNWKLEVAAEAKRKGYVYTLGGRKRRLRSTFKDVANWRLEGYGERQAVSTKVQGSAADVIRRTMIRAEREFPELLFLAQVHDECIWEYETIPSKAMLGRLRTCMEVGHGFDLKVPMGFVPVVCSDWSQKSSGGADWWSETEEE